MVDDKVGNPNIKGAKVIATVEKQGRKKKIGKPFQTLKSYQK